MIQIETPHPACTFLPCSCGKAPRHIVSRGRLRHEPALSRGGTTRHHLECNPCARRTALHASLQRAENEWGRKFAQPALPLRAVGSLPLRGVG